jgi:NhaP-type Na+/H+ or K+/H+ antiporter
LTTDAGDPFPDRDLLLFCAFVAVLVTLVGQGLTFAPLVRRLGVRADAADEARLRNEARAAAVRAGLARLDDLDAEQHSNLEDEAIDDLRAALRGRLDRYERRLSVLQFAEGGEIPVSPEYEAALRVRQAVLDAEREELLRWRDVGRLPDESLRTLQRELDHQEGALPSRRPA